MGVREQQRRPVTQCKAQALWRLAGDAVNRDLRQDQERPDLTTY